MTSLLFMTVIATEIAYSASIRLRLGAQERDDAKAEALAVSGVNMYRLILVASKGLANNPMLATVEQMMGVDLGDALWQWVPFINSGLMRMLFVAGDGASDSEVTDMAAEGLSDEQRAESRESSGLERNFLDFDGDFTAEVTDEDRKINVAGFKATNRVELQEDPTGVELYGLMSGQRRCPSAFGSDDTSSQNEAAQEDLDRFFLDRNLDRWELIGNLADWTDADNTRIYDGGSEDVLYNTLPKDPYLPKNAGFDTLQEIRLVQGWNLDDVWEKFGSSVTVYGKGKVNINTADCGVIWALLKSYIEPTPTDDQVYRIMTAMEEQKTLAGSFHDANAFTTFIASQGVQVDSKLKSVVTTESKVFRVTSTGEVNQSTVSVEAVLDFSSSQIGKIVFWRVR